MLPYSLSTSTPQGNIALKLHVPSTFQKFVIISPGFLDTKDYPHITELANDLASEGYLVARYDPLGTWEGGDEITNYTITNYLLSISKITEYLTENFHLQKGILIGHSLGGLLSFVYASNDSRIEKVIGIMPATVETFRRLMSEKNLSIHAKNAFYTALRDIPGEKGRSKTFWVPVSFFRGLFSLEKQIFLALQNTKVHKIFIAGEKDDVVYPSEVKKMYSMAASPKKFVLLKGIDHDYRRSTETIQRVNRVVVELVD